MIATGCGNTLPPDLVTGAQPSERKDTPPTYVGGILEQLRNVHQKVVPAEKPTQPNPYRPRNLIWISTPPLERTSKLAPQWIGLFRVSKVPNPHQWSYSTDCGSQTVHIHHAKPALLDLLTKFPAQEEKHQ